MAVLTKTSASMQTSAANTSGSTTTSSSQALTSSWGGVITMLITNGATGPTTACQALIKHSMDAGSTWKTLRVLSGGLGNSAITPLVYEVPDSVFLVQVVFTGNTGQSVTVEAQIAYITAFA